jgi:hypothetical protein
MSRNVALRLEGNPAKHFTMLPWDITLANLALAFEVRTIDLRLLLYASDI